MEAEASIDSRPLEGFTPRQGQGLPLFGKSFNTPPSRESARIDFQFDRAAFTFKFLPFTLPYPVPFRLLGDERKVREDGARLSGGAGGCVRCGALWRTAKRPLLAVQAVWHCRRWHGCCRRGFHCSCDACMHAKVIAHPAGV